MNNYLKLVNFEIQRFWKLFVALISVIIVAQVIGAIIASSSFVSSAQRTMQQEKIIESEYVLRYGGAYSMHNFLNSGFFVFSFMFAVAVLIIYVFFIWYRDWLGKSSFIYRLLMLPTERRNVYFAKLTSILLLVLFLVGIQVVLLEIVQFIIQWIVPEPLRVEYDAFSIYSHDVLSFLYPHSLLYFILFYGGGITMVASIFTAILFERSFQLKGILFAALYLFISSGVILIPAIIAGTSNNYFYFDEIVMMTIACSILMFAVAIFIADYLLKRKITV